MELPRILALVFGVGGIVLIGFVMYRLLDAGVAFRKARREANRRH